jgi:hypothetical protein
MAPAAITPRGTASRLPPMTSAISSLYAVKLSFLLLSYQTWASRYFWFGAGPLAHPFLRGVAVPAAIAIG